MATKDGFYPGDPLPLFLSTDEPEQNSTDQPKQNIGNDRPVILLRVLKAGILVAMGIAIGVAASAGNPMTLSADVTASLFDKAASPPGTDQSAPIIQSAVTQSPACAEALPPTVKNVPNQTRTENSGSSSEDLFREFQAWSAEQDGALAKVRDAPAPAVKNAPASVRSVQKQRARAQNQSVQNAEEPSFLQSLLSRFEASPAQRGP
jgi:hypothetical protein